MFNSEKINIKCVINVYTYTTFAFRSDCNLKNETHYAEHLEQFKNILSHLMVRLVNFIDCNLYKNAEYALRVRQEFMIMNIVLRAATSRVIIKL